MMNIQRTECARSAVQLGMCMYSTVRMPPCLCRLVTFQIAQSFKVQLLTDRWMMDRTWTKVCGVCVWNLSACMCVRLCLCCMKWNGQWAFWVARGTLPSDWSDKGRGGVERGTRIDPMMNDQREAADVMKCVRLVCFSFLFSLIHLALDMFVVYQLCYIRSPIIAIENQHDGWLNEPWMFFFV